MNTNNTKKGEQNYSFHIFVIFALSKMSMTIRKLINFAIFSSLKPKIYD